MPFKMHYYYFSEKNKNKKKHVCLPYLNFQICYPKHTYFFIWPQWDKGVWSYCGVADKLPIMSQVQSLDSPVCRMRLSPWPGPKVIKQKLISCSTQLSMKFQLLIETKLLKNKAISCLSFILSDVVFIMQKMLKCQQLLAF